MRMRFRRILLAVRDPAHAPRAALRKAASLARASGGSIELFHAISAPGDLEAFVRATVLEEVSKRLERIARSPLLRGCRVRCVAEWDYPPHEAIVRRVMKSGSDLVVAATQSHGLGGRLWLRNTDWELIRHCPCPLLLVKSARAYKRPSVIVAIDPFHTHAKPTRLDERLLAAGDSLAKLLRGSVHAFHAYMPLMATVIGPMGEPVMWESPEVESVHSSQVAREFNREAARAKVPARRRHLVMSDVAEGLETTVRRVRAPLVVMGALSRSGLRRFVIGNTAERVLDQLTCDVLILKPRGLKRLVPKRV
ncbi:MAG TPA: universal stress protein [Steroidobacteraceae bacterium]|nr:universal stress protein [Steroidobacteraceae bacterium]